jgi:non-ribosomal peptide synthetase component E (peptide arylation enzyme)
LNVLSGATVLFEPILFHARLNPERPGLVAFESIGRELSYGDIVRRAEAATDALVQAGIAPRQRIGVHCRDRLLQIVVVLALSRIGDVTLAVSPNGLFAHGSIDLLVTDDASRKDEVKTVLIAATALAASAAQASGPVAIPSGNATWRFDAVTMGIDSFRARIARRAQAKGIGGISRWLCAVGIHSELGLSAVLECLWSGGLAVLSNSAFEDDVHPIALYEADHLFVDANLAAGYLRIFDKTIRMSAPLRSAVIAGAALDEASVQRMKQHVSPDTVVYLDLPETGSFAACSYWQIGKRRRYWPLAGIELRVDESGLIAIRGEGVLSTDDDGWYHSSLTGSLTRDGALVLASEPPS